MSWILLHLWILFTMWPSRLCGACDQRCMILIQWIHISMKQKTTNLWWKVVNLVTENVSRKKKKERKIIWSWGCSQVTSEFAFCPFVLHSNANSIQNLFSVTTIIQQIQWGSIVFCHICCCAVQRDKSQTHYWLMKSNDFGYFWPELYQGLSAKCNSTILLSEL